MGIGEQHDCITHRVKLHMYVHVQCIHEVTRGIKAVCLHVSESRTLYVGMAPTLP